MNIFHLILLMKILMMQKNIIDYKNMLINILNTIDDKLDKNDISNNIKIYSIIQFIIPIIIILLVFTAIYK